MKPCHLVYQCVRLLSNIYEPGRTSHKSPVWPLNMQQQPIMLCNLMLSNSWTHLAREGERLAVVRFPHSACVAHAQAIIRLHPTYAPCGRACTVNRNLKLSRLKMLSFYVLHPAQASATCSKLCWGVTGARSCTGWLVAFRVDSTMTGGFACMHLYGSFTKCAG